MSHFPLRIDIKAAQHDRTWDTMLRYGQDTDAEPIFGGYWLFDHFVPINGHVAGPCLDGWTLLAALATATKRARLGLMVGCNSYRHPAVLAKIATTIDHASGGRLDMGLGAGWFELEYHMYGIPFPSAADRIRALDEACTAIKLLWTEELASFDGKYYSLHEARHEPKPIQQPYPPFTIGGGGEKLTLRVVAKHAAIYNATVGTPEELQHKNAVLDEHCAAIGRDPATIRRSYQTYLRTPDELVGLRDRVAPFRAVGVDHLVIGVPTDYHAGLVAAIAQEVKPLLG